jgi:hypothetical protein
MSTQSDNSYQAFERINSPKHVTGIDYVQTMYKAANLPVDFVVQFSRLFWPDFLLVDGKTFVKSLYEPERHASLLATDPMSAQYWSNLLEVTGLFDDLSVDQARGLADVIANCWNAKLAVEFEGGIDRARAVWDQPTDEVFVSIEAEKKSS